MDKNNETGSTAPDATSGTLDPVLDPVQGKVSGLLPVAVFLALFIGSGIILNDFYAMPAVVAFLGALAVAFLQNPKRSFNEKLESVASSMGQSNVMIMCLVFVLAGAFTGAVSAA